MKYLKPRVQLFEMIIEVFFYLTAIFLIISVTVTKFENNIV